MRTPEGDAPGTYVSDGRRSNRGRRGAGRLDLRPGGASPRRGGRYRLGIWGRPVLSRAGQSQTHPRRIVARRPHGETQFIMVHTNLCYANVRTTLQSADAASTGQPVKKIANLNPSIIHQRDSVTVPWLLSDISTTKAVKP